MKTLKIALLIMLPLLYTLTGCKKTEAPAHASYTPEQNKQALETSASNVVSNLNTIQTSSGVTSIMNMYIFMGQSSPFGAKKNVQIPFVSSISSLLQVNSDPSSVSDLLKGQMSTHFVYADNVGEYTWNATSKSWSKATSTSIIFKFPSTNGGASNNAVLTITDYADMQITSNGLTAYMPTSVKFNMSIDGTKQLDFVMTGSFKADGTPTATSLSLYVNPFTLAMTYSNTNTTVSTETKWTVGSSNIVSEGYTLTGDFSALTSSGQIGQYVNTIVGYVQVADAKMVANIDAAHLRKINNPSIVDINTYVILTLKWSDDSKIADCSFVDNPTGAPKVQLKFIDGSTADAQVYFDNAMLKFENFVNSIKL